MNTQARNIIAGFTSRSNQEMLFNTLCRKFKSPRVYAFVQDNFNSIFAQFVHQIKLQIYLSDPVIDIPAERHICFFNKQFIDDKVGYITAHVIGGEVPIYTVTDGMPTGRAICGSTKDVLKNWDTAPARNITLREDQQAQSGNPYYGNNARCQVETGITFCDQSMYGTSNHESQLVNTTYIKALNQGNDSSYANTAFGNSTADSDARLLSRRTFRNNEQGIENGVPVYEQRLYRRQLERNIDEGLGAVEFEYSQQPFNTAPVRCRLDNRVRINGAPQKMDLANHTGLRK